MEKQDMRTEIERLLWLIRDEPTLLDPAPLDVSTGQMDARRTQAHTCLRCGNVAMNTYIVFTGEGPRWLDLCTECSVGVY